VAVTVLSRSAELLPSSQFTDDHLPEGMSLLSLCALTGVVSRPVPAPLAVPVIAQRPLATSLRRTVKFEVLWRVNTNTAAIEAFTEGLETALVGLGLAP